MDRPEDLTPTIVDQRATLAVEMMLTGGVIDSLLDAGRSPEQIAAMAAAYAYSVILAGVDGPRMLHDPALNQALREGIANYPANVRRAAAQAVSDVLKEATRR